MKQLSMALLFVAGSVFSSNAQDLKLPAMSPTAKMTQDFSTSTIELTYSRPSTRGRVIFGDLVPYNTVWRTGANSATRVKFGEDVTFGGIAVKAGDYALYTIPGKSEWEVILNKGLGNWGAYGYNKEDDIARFKVKSEQMASNVSTFTMLISDISFNSCSIDLMWEKTKVSLPVVAKNEERLNASIDKAITTPNIPYFSAASYYYETNQNLDKAYEYVTKATEANPKAFYMWHLKAKIAQKLGKKDDALAAAEKSIETAKGSPAEAEYVRNNEKLIQTIKKM